jgi:hypothetical protein
MQSSCLQLLKRMITDELETGLDDMSVFRERYHIIDDEKLVDRLCRECLQNEAKAVSGRMCAHVGHVCSQIGEYKRGKQKVFKYFMRLVQVKLDYRIAPTLLDARLTSLLKEF